jgi:hypothetical protein
VPNFNELPFVEYLSLVVSLIAMVFALAAWLDRERSIYRAIKIAQEALEVAEEMVRMNQDINGEE